MPKRPPSRLKVFQTRLGFYDSVVAAPSQAAALRAWDVHQNLFASGEAEVTTDPAAVTAATEHPGAPLLRPIGSKEPFQLEPAGLPEPPASPGRKASAPNRKASSPPPPPDRSRLDAAEAALRKLDEARKQQERALTRQKAALDAKRDAAQDAYVEARKKATSAVVAARQSYRDAGGSE
jgi:hypothetical protein